MRQPFAVHALFLLLLSLPVGQVAAQTAVSISVRSDRYSGNNEGPLGDGRIARFRPTSPELFAAHLTRQRGNVRIGVGIGYATTPVSALATGGTAVITPNTDDLVEFDLEVARRFAGRANGPRLWGYATPSIAYWNLSGGERINLSGTLGLEFESPVSGPLAAYSRVALGLQRSNIPQRDLPEGFTTSALWRRSMGVGLRLRL